MVTLPGLVSIVTLAPSAGETRLGTQIDSGVGVLVLVGVGGTGVLVLVGVGVLVLVGVGDAPAAVIVTGPLQILELFPWQSLT